MNKWFVIINPVSGNGYIKRKKTKVLRALQNLNDGFKVTYTQYAKHEIKLVHQAIEKGFYKFICVGGDGTLHHIINGIFTQKMKIPTQIQIGVIPLGTGNDWVKQYNIPKNISANIAILNNNNVTKQDIGSITLANQKYYFNNVAGIGLDGFVVKNLNKRAGKFSYILAAFKSVFHFKKSKLKIRINKKVITANILLLSIGICRFSGGGMQFTNQVDPQDEMLDVTVVKDLHPLALFLNVHRLYNGKLHKHKAVNTYKTNKLSVVIKDKNKPYIQADGEFLGIGDFTIELIPNAINFVIP